MTRRIIFVFTIMLTFVALMKGQHRDSNQVIADQELIAHSTTNHTENHASHDGHHEEFDPAATAIHHISDANVYTILDAIRIPLPMILYTKGKGWNFFSSGKFQAGHHDNGHMAYNGFALHEGSVHRILDESFPKGEVAINNFTVKTELVDGKEKEVKYAEANGSLWKMEQKSILDGGILGGGMTGFYDFSITKNVVAMLLVCLFFWFVFQRMRKAYETNPTKAPKGLTNMVESIFLFIRDEVAIPFIGKDKYKKYFSLLLSIFFFILGLNLFGQVPFFGSINASGNLAITMVLALIVFIVVNAVGNKDYWKHIFWMPGVPAWVKTILTPVEILGVFIKPLTLMLRLAGNISAGHIAILSFISLIFIFGKSGESIGGSVAGTVMAIPLTIFMMAIELLVAFLQAYVFTLLTASYIGSAIEEHDHDDHH
jgi:F-type H+-transporting ATPase subunit a